MSRILQVSQITQFILTGIGTFRSSDSLIEPPCIILGTTENVIKLLVQHFQMRILQLTIPILTVTVQNNSSARKTVPMSRNKRQLFNQNLKSDVLFWFDFPQICFPQMFWWIYLEYINVIFCPQKYLSHRFPYVINMSYPAYFVYTLTCKIFIFCWMQMQVCLNY